MTHVELLNLMTKAAKAYRSECRGSLQRNTHMHNATVAESEMLDQVIIDAILTDYINFVGVRGGCDYALYASDLADPATQPIGEYKSP